MKCGAATKVLLATGSNRWYESEPLREFERLAGALSCPSLQLTDDPGMADIVLFVNPHQYLDRPALRPFRRHPLVRAFPQKCFVFDERDEPTDLLPGVFVSMPRSRLDLTRHRAFAYPRLVTDTRPARTATPDLLFSFQGRAGSDLRRRLLSMRTASGLVEDTSAVDFFSGGRQSDRTLSAAERYIEVVSRSRFVLCPKGAGTSSFRLFETLAAGRVPVILSDEWVEPRGIDWEGCSLRLPESIAPRDLICAMERADDRWPTLRQAALEAFDRNFDGSVWLNRMVAELLDLMRCRAAGPRSGFLVDPLVVRQRLRITKRRILAVRKLRMRS